MTVTTTAVAADFDEAFDIERYFTAKITFHLQMMLNIFTQLADFGLGEIFHPGVGINADFREHLLRCGQADAVNVGQADFNALFSWQVNTCNACHVSYYTSVCFEKVSSTQADNPTGPGETRLRAGAR